MAGTYIDTKMGLSPNSEALQARSSIDFVMPTLNHDDIARTRCSTPRKSRRSSSRIANKHPKDYQPSRHAPQTRRVLEQARPPHKLRINLLAGTINSYSSSPSGWSIGTTATGAGAAASRSTAAPPTSPYKPVEGCWSWDWGGALILLIR